MEFEEEDIMQAFGLTEAHEPEEDLDEDREESLAGRSLRTPLRGSGSASPSRTG